MQARVLVATTLAVFVVSACGASLRTKAGNTLHAMRARASERGSPKTAYNGEKFHSILDHPSTARFFEGKDESEIKHMIDSAVFAHFVGHGHPLHQKKAARTSEKELRGTSFVQLAAKHGVDFETLRVLHEKSGKGHHDMEIWWREQALHPSVHVDAGSPSVELSEEMHAGSNPLEMSFIQIFQAEKAKKMRRAVEGTINSDVTPIRSQNRVEQPTVHANAEPPHREGETTMDRPIKDTLAREAGGLKDIIVAHTDATTFLAEKTLTQGQRMVAKSKTMSKRKIRSKTSVTGENLGDLCVWSCDASNARCVNGKCIYNPAHSQGGGQHCYGDVDCESNLCIGNGGTVHGDGGNCMYNAGSIQDHNPCSKNTECASGRCIGNGGGLLSSLGHRNAGTCDYQDGSRTHGESCNKNANCDSGRCIGNGGGLLSSFGHMDAGYCDYMSRSRAPGESCNKNDNCESERCVGNGGGLLSSFGVRDAGFCDYMDGSRKPVETCNKNANCQWGNCIGNGGGLLSSFGARDAGHCGFRDASRGGTCSCENKRSANEIQQYEFWKNMPQMIRNVIPKPDGMVEFEHLQEEASDELITRAYCKDTLGCIYTHVYQSCNNNIECKSNQCNGNLGGACPIFGCGECAAEPGTILPWKPCATDEECMSNDCDFESPFHDRGWCTLDNSRKARSGCRCQKDHECLSGTCAGPLFDQNSHRCTAETGTTVAGDSCQRNSECVSGTCVGNVFGATSGACAGPLAIMASGTSGTPTNVRLNLAHGLGKTVNQGQSITVSPHGEHATCAAEGTYTAATAANIGSQFITITSSVHARMSAGDSCKITYFAKSGNGASCQHNSFCESNCCRGNLIGLVEGRCSPTTACVSGLGREAGRWIADIIKEGLALLAEGLIKVVRWIISAAEAIFAEVSVTKHQLHSSLEIVKTLVIAYDTHCPRSEAAPHARPTTYECMERAERLTTALAEADKAKQMFQYKAAVDKSKVTACEGATAAENGNNCVPRNSQVDRNSPVENQLAAWVPQYWADTIGVSFKCFNADIHKIFDFQTMEYGYASDLGLTVDSDLVSAVVSDETLGDMDTSDLLGSFLSEISASASSNVGWKGRNRGNWKNLNDGYTGDAFGVSASLPLKPLDAGVFSISGGVQIGIQSDFTCSFLDDALPFVGTSPDDMPNENCPSGPGLGPAAIANDIANTMFVWKGTKMVGLSLAAEYDPPNEDAPTDGEDAAVEAVEMVAEEGIDLSVDASISYTKLFKQYGGCFGPEPRVDGQQHSEEEHMSALLDMLGYMWLGEDARMEPVDGSPWFVRMANILGHLTSSTAKMPQRVIQSLLAVVQHVTSRSEMPGNCGCMWCRASNLGECIPCTPGTQGLTKDTCRLRHWCKHSRDQSECFVKDYSNNFYMKRLAHADIVNRETCKDSVEDGGNVEFIRKGKCMLRSKCMAIIPEVWSSRGYSSADSEANARAHCTNSTACAWQSDNHRCGPASETLSTNVEWVDLETETESKVPAELTPIGGIGNHVCQSGCHDDNGCEGTLVCFRRQSSLRQHFRTEEYCSRHEDICANPTERCIAHTETCGSAPCTRYGWTYRNVCVNLPWVGRRCSRIPHRWTCTARGPRPCTQTCTESVTECSLPKTEANGWDLNQCTQTSTREVENVEPCPPDSPTCPQPPTEEGNPDAAVPGCSGEAARSTNYCVDPDWSSHTAVAQEGLVWDKETCEQHNYGTDENPTHLWAHTFMYPTQIVHNFNGGASNENGEDTTSHPGHKHPADTAPIPILADVADGETEMTEEEDTNNQGALKKKIDKVLTKLEGFSRPSAGNLLRELVVGIGAVQQKMDEMSESGTSMVVHRGINTELAEQDVCYEERRDLNGNLLHQWPY